MDIGDPEYERAMAEIERMAADVGPRRPSTAGRRAMFLRGRAIIEEIARHAHTEGEQRRGPRPATG